MDRQLSPENEAARARTVRGATIAWGAGQYLDLADPDNIRVSLEDYAYCLAYTVRWRGQCRLPDGSRPFYSTLQHCVFGAEMMLAAHGAEPAREFLFHESDEVPFGDFPGPSKQIPAVAETCRLAARIGGSIDRAFGIEFRHHDLVKRWDIRMLHTEKRDLLVAEYLKDDWSHDGGDVPIAGYEPFAVQIVPYADPATAVKDFLLLERITRP